ncbi:hypothetical protein IEQ34_007780 [Dendrobium chrysotoxum]|uniref:Uncharacterized protein n=1 Tax=Dendrobium chrysotoxum TaxID=161865 RepID=A0AAV7H5D4_DENCH|nr:hypothetical protein IEQ34_007780 [Dendrobium chrysotoxum]
MPPVKRLLLRSSSSRLKQRERDEGIGPESKFPSSISLFIDANFPKLSGIGPLNWFKDASRIRRPHLELGTLSNLMRNSASDPVAGEVEKVDSSEAADLQRNVASNAVAAET